uniref:biotin synthase n=2 Tax=Rhizochromulina marina TaxID=1034831 RepID=A0A7S2WLM1_9STRA
MHLLGGNLMALLLARGTLAAARCWRGDQAVLRRSRVMKQVVPVSALRPLASSVAAYSLDLDPPADPATPRHDWTRSEIDAIFNQPFSELLHQASAVHRQAFDPQEVQRCTLLSIKTGGCTEDCKYCSQSVRYKTHVKPTPTLKLNEVLEAARRAKAVGSTRFCMGAAWREMGRKKKAFAEILEMVREVRKLDMEVCCTLGMLNEVQAMQLKEAGLTAYNHNLDTSPEFYPKVITTRSYEDRLQTIENVRNAGISVCCGGILGLGESENDRVGLLHTLATLPEHPESVPINALVSVDGTPLGAESAPEPVTALDMTRMIATARLVMPRTMIRLSAGRLDFTEAEQALMFFAGANSVFSGDQLLTTPNPSDDKDQALFDKLGLQGKPAFKEAVNVRHERLQAPAPGPIRITHVRRQ